MVLDTTIYKKFYPILDNARKIEFIAENEKYIDELIADERNEALVRMERFELKHCANILSRKLMNKYSAIKDNYEFLSKLRQIERHDFYKLLSIDDCNRLLLIQNEHMKNETMCCLLYDILFQACVIIAVVMK